MRRVQVQGCLPALLALLLVAGLGALVLTAGVAVWLGTLGILGVLGLARSRWRLLGAGGHGAGAPSPGRRGATGASVESLPPGWIEREPGGPVVEAGRPAPPEPGADAGGGSGAGGPTRDGERTGPPGG